MIILISYSKYTRLLGLNRKKKECEDKLFRAGGKRPEWRLNYIEDELSDIRDMMADLEEQLSTPVDIISYREKMNRFLKRRIDAEAIYV